MNKAYLTYSAMSSFQNCRKLYYNRYVRNLVSKDTDPVLHLGTVWHNALEQWYKAGEPGDKITTIQRMIDESFPQREADPQQKKDWHLVHTMFEAYVARYLREDFEVFGAEVEFLLPMINPSTKRQSRTFQLRGKVDGLCRMKETNELFLLEHKSASQVDGSYLERLPRDFQINVYCYAMGRHLGEPVVGVIYNVCVKSWLKQNPGETEEQFEVRRAILLAKSKTGTTTAKRQLPESDHDFRQRLNEKYTDPEMFVREHLLISQKDLQRTEQEIWTISQKILEEQRSGDWLGNYQHCFRYNKPCSFWALCRSEDNPIILENFYDIKPPHTELSEVADTIQSVF